MQQCHGMMEACSQAYHVRQPILTPRESCILTNIGITPSMLALPTAVLKLSPPSLWQFGAQGKDTACQVPKRDCAGRLKMRQFGVHKMGTMSGGICEISEVTLQ